MADGAKSYINFIYMSAKPCRARLSVNRFNPPNEGRLDHSSSDGQRPADAAEVKEVKAMRSSADGANITKTWLCDTASSQVRSHIALLREQLKELEQRLGTPLETSADLEEAREITHALRNYLQLKLLCNYLDSASEKTTDCKQAQYS